MSEDRSRDRDKEPQEPEIIVHDRRLITQMDLDGDLSTDEEKTEDAKDQTASPQAEETPRQEPVEEKKAAESRAEGGPSAESPGPGEGRPGEMPDLDVFGVFELTLSMFVQQAWIHLGLIANPATNLTVKDFKQARIAIDAVAGLLQVFEPHLDVAQARELKRLVADLRMNYVQLQEPPGKAS